MKKTSCVQASGAPEELACPECSETDFDITVEPMANGEHLTKRTKCKSCGWEGHHYPIDNLEDENEAAATGK